VLPLPLPLVVTDDAGVVIDDEADVDDVGEAEVVVVVDVVVCIADEENRRTLELRVSATHRLPAESNVMPSGRHSPAWVGGAFSLHEALVKLGWPITREAGIP
jgi:hypothetical protein